MSNFIYDEEQALCICPSGHQLYQTGRDMLFNGYRVDSFRTPITACRDCHLRDKCLRYPERTKQRQLMVVKHRQGEQKPRSGTRKKDAPTQRKFDTPFGRDLYSKRMGTVEPVFANLQNKGMRPFALRGRTTGAKTLQQVHIALVATRSRCFPTSSLGRRRDLVTDTC